MNGKDICQSKPRTSSVRVVAVVVTYHPQPEQLALLLKALQPQVIHTVVVDNGSPLDVLSHIQADAEALRVSLVALGSNHGVAKAQNVGIEHARTKGANYVILFDHDSVPPPNLVDALLSVAVTRSELGELVAAVGPRFIDLRRTDIASPFYEIKGLWLNRKTCTSERLFVKTDVLISSGCLLPMSALDHVGLMREDLFIDYVDTEWCLRARASGYQLYGACGAVMQHELGDEPVRILGRSFPMHSPLRHYYHFRNGIWLLRQPWVPLNWRLVDLWKLLLKLGFYSFFSPQRSQQIRMMAIGIFHGWTGRMGPWGV